MLASRHALHCKDGKDNIMSNSTQQLLHSNSSISESLKHHVTVEVFTAKLLNIGGDHANQYCQKAYTASTGPSGPCCCWFAVVAGCHPKAVPLHCCIKGLT